MPARPWGSLGLWPRDPPGPGGHYFFTNNALTGILIFLETGHVKIVIVKVSEEEHIWLLVTSQ